MILALFFGRKGKTAQFAEAVRFGPDEEHHLAVTKCIGNSAVNEQKVCTTKCMNFYLSSPETVQHLPAGLFYLFFSATDERRIWMT